MKNIYLILVTLCFNLPAENLLEIYQEALEKDPNFNLNKADLELNREYLNQQRSSLGPRLTIGGQTNWNEYYQDRLLSNDYNTFNYNLNLTQPIFRLDSWFQVKRLKENFKAAEARFAYQQQDLMVRVTSAYFNILSAKSALAVARATEKALENQYQRIQERFNVGAASKIELAEAKAAYNKAISDSVLAKGNQEISFEELNSIVGREITLIAPINDDLELNIPDKSIDEEVNFAINSNLLILESKKRLDGSKANSKSATARFLPKIDASANVNRRTSKQYTFDGLDSDLDLPFFIPTETETRNFGIQFSLPLFTSGLNNSQRRQALLEEVKSEEQVILIERNVIQQVRSLYTALQTAKLNIEALKASEESSKDALEATRLGYELNSRNLIDLLQAERSYSEVQNRLNQSVFGFIVTSLQYKQALGTLDPKDILELNKNLL
ncbi:TolC family outer membrane protein [SAR86 cluster bacterium]|mgnify:FL=1|jgi:outer membrane protein|nr:TolC family outer membrane protein [SAR86 cluster bacterium]